MFVATLVQAALITSRLSKSHNSLVVKLQYAYMHMSFKSMTSLLDESQLRAWSPEDSAV